MYSRMTIASRDCVWFISCKSYCTVANLIVLFTLYCHERQEFWMLLKSQWGKNEDAANPIRQMTCALVVWCESLYERLSCIMTYRQIVTHIKPHTISTSYSPNHVEYGSQRCCPLKRYGSILALIVVALLLLSSSLLLLLLLLEQISLLMKKY